MNYRRKLIAAATFMGGLYFFLEFILPPQVLGVRIGAYHDQISVGFITIGAMAVGLGLINLFRVHGARILFKRKGWSNSAALLAGLLLMMAVTSYDWRLTSSVAREAQQLAVLRDFAVQISSDAVNERVDVPPIHIRNKALHGALLSELSRMEDQIRQSDAAAPKLLRQELAGSIGLARTTAAKLLVEPGSNLAVYEEIAQVISTAAPLWLDLLNARYEASLGRKFYQLLFDGLFVALGSAMFSLLGFHIAAAAYRAFRIKSGESAVMMLAALVVMLGQIPFGVWIWHGFPDVRLWLLSVPNTAAFRAIGIGAAVAALVMAFRMWFSLESENFSEGKR